MLKVFSDAFEGLQSFHFYKAILIIAVCTDYCQVAYLAIDSPSIRAAESRFEQSLDYWTNKPTY